MQVTHYVSKVAPGMFYVLTYRPTTLLRVAILESDTESVTEACKILRAIHGGKWEAADSGQAAWSRAIIKVDGSAPTLQSPRGWGVVSI